MSKKILAALGSLVVAGAALTACSSDGDAGTTSSTSSSSATTSSTAPESSEYLQDDRVVPPQSYTSSEDRLDEVMRSVASSEGIYLPEGLGSAYAQDVCDLLDNGNDVFDVVLIALRDLPELGLEMEEHAFLIGASIGGACPEYEYLVG